MPDRYHYRIINWITQVEAAVKFSDDIDLDLAKRVEALGRRMRYKAQHTGRTAKVEKHRERVNFLYHETSCNIATIARNVGISETSVRKLIGPKPEGAITPKTEQVRPVD